MLSDKIYVNTKILGDFVGGKTPAQSVLEVGQVHDVVSPVSTRLIDHRNMQSPGSSIKAALVLVIRTFIHRVCLTG